MKLNSVKWDKIVSSEEKGGLGLGACLLSVDRCYKTGAGGSIIRKNIYGWR